MSTQKINNQNSKDSSSSQKVGTGKESVKKNNQNPSKPLNSSKVQQVKSTADQKLGKTDSGALEENQSKMSNGNMSKSKLEDEGTSAKSSSEPISQNVTSTTSSASSNNGAGDFDVIQLVKGDSSKDPKVTNVGNEVYYSLETIHANNEADPVENRDGFKTLVRFSKASKRINVKLDNKVSDGQHGIANSSADIIDAARRRATGGNVKLQTPINNVTHPDVMNFVSSFNVSGHIPLPDFKRVTE